MSRENSTLRETLGLFFSVMLTETIPFFINRNWADIMEASKLDVMEIKLLRKHSAPFERYQSND